MLEKNSELLPVIHQASNGMEGLELYKRFRPDLIITDIKMPYKTGLELISDIRKEDKDTQIILISGYNEFEYARKAISLGVSGYLLKPIDREELFFYVQEAGKKIALQKKHSNSNLEEIIASARQFFLRRLVNGEIKSNDEISRLLGQFGLDLKADRNTCIVIRSSREDGLDQEQKDYLAGYFKDYLGFLHPTYEAMVIISSSDATYIMHEITGMEKELSCYDLYCGIGTQAYTLSGISRSFKSALLAISYSFFETGRRIFLSSDFTNVPKGISTADIRTKELADLLFTGTDNEISRWISSFIHEMKCTSGISPQVFKGMCIFLISDIKKQIINNTNMTKDRLSDQHDADINRKRTVTDLEAYLQKYMLRLRHEVIPEAIAENDPVIYQVRRYVDQHIEEVISQKDISDILNMNPTYFSTYFKMKTGDTFRNYVNNKKNEYAKKLLLDPYLSMEEIAEKLGYTDYRSFHRIFKSMNGITPTDYRKQLKDRR